jgi:hypothetical protein
MDGERMSIQSRAWLGFAVLVLQGVLAQEPPREEAPLATAEDKEAYRPAPDAERVRAPRADAEATQPRPGAEATPEKADWEAFKPVPGFEDERLQDTDSEAYRPRPEFEATRPGDPKQDRELQAPDLKLAERSSAQVLAENEIGLGLTVGKTPLSQRHIAKGRGYAIEAGRWGVEDAISRQTLSFRTLISEQTAAQLLQGSQLRATANRQRYPTGILEGIAIADATSLLYLAEIIQDVSVLTDADRDGFVVTQVTSALGEPVAEGTCLRFYEVPVKIARGAQTLQLHAGESATLRDGATSYRAQVLKSRYATARSCPYSVEEPTNEIQYVIWKLPARE